MIWWLWIVFGLVLLAAELATPGALFFLFFGLSAVVVGILAALGAVSDAGFQWLWFSALAVVALAALRRPLRARLSRSVPGHRVDSLVGESAVTLVPLAGTGVGKVELRGTTWNARLSNGPALEAGQRCVVEKIEGLMLWVRPE